MKWIWLACVAVLNLPVSAFVSYLVAKKFSFPVWSKKREPLQQIAFWCSLLLIKVTYAFLLSVLLVVLLAIGLLRTTQDEAKNGVALSALQTLFFLGLCGTLTIQDPMGQPYRYIMIVVLVGLGLWRVFRLLKGK